MRLRAGRAPAYRVAGRYDIYACRGIAQIYRARDVRADEIELDAVAAASQPYASIREAIDDESSDRAVSASDIQTGKKTAGDVAALQLDQQRWRPTRTACARLR